MNLAMTLRTSLFAATLASLGGCGGGDSSDGDPPPPAASAPAPSPAPAPAPVTVTIGGALSGLSGSVTLQDNGADNLALSAGGPFVFATPVNSGANYSVSVMTQPAGQTCTVTNGTGTAATSNVTNVSVTCTGTQASSPGSLDTDFGTNGKVTTDFSGAPSLSKVESHS
jgi:hypothetical protein